MLKYMQTWGLTRSLDPTGLLPQTQIRYSCRAAAALHQDEKAAREQRAAVLADLAQHSLSAGQLALLRPTAHQGQRETKRQRLRRALAHQRLGLPAPEDVTDLEPARIVHLKRPAGMRAARKGLPIVGMEQEVMEAVAERDVVLLCGETGCGKTTQVPQFLLEAGYGSAAFAERSGRIGVTQPRRVAAVAAATRIAQELGCELGGLVGYQVRYERRASANTAVKVMTDGILLRELQTDFLLQQYSVLVLDEAHERSLNTDLLLGLLSRIVPLRRQMAAEAGSGVAPLKLLIMSATLRMEDFAGNPALFPAPPPVVRVPARQYPVRVHFARRTELHDYVGAAYAKVRQLHRALPPGGVLVFLTGQREVEALCRRLRQAHLPGRGFDDSADPVSGELPAKGYGPPAGGVDAFGGDAAEEASEGADEARAASDADWDDFDTEAALEEEEETLVLGGEGFSPEQLAAAERHLEQSQGVVLGALADTKQSEPAPLHVLPLYAMLPAAAQARVFGACPPGARLIVVATNVAETSLTIPGVRYVVDAGRAKAKRLEASGALARYEVGWVSKAAAEQRAGRAGRMGPGLCYRLYSSAVYNDAFPAHSEPEVLATPLEGVALTMRSLGIDKVSNFPFPTPPERGALAVAEAALVALGAMGPKQELSAHGRAMAALPITPRHARMLLQAAEDVAAGAAGAAQALPYAVALAAALSTESPFIMVDSITAQDDDAARRQRSAAGAAHARLRAAGGDTLSALNALCAFERAGRSEVFCRDHYLHARNLCEAASLHTQLARALARAAADGPLAPVAAAMAAAAQALGNSQGSGINEILEPPGGLPPPPAAVLQRLRRAIAAGWADQVARRVHSAEYLATRQGTVDAGEGSGKRRAVRYCAQATDEPVFLHPRSALARAAPEYVAYTQLVRSAKRPYLAGVTEVEVTWLADVAPPLVTLSPPLDAPAPRYVPAADAVLAWHGAAYGRHGWELLPMARPAANAVARARLFAAALLGGRVLPALAGLRAALVMPPEQAAQLTAQGQRRVGELVCALQSAGVDSRAALAAAWRHDSAWLRRELGAWVRPAAHTALDAMWPMLLSEAAAPAAARIRSDKAEDIPETALLMPSDGEADTSSDKMLHIIPLRPRANSGPTPAQQVKNGMLAHSKAAPLPP
ncbi:hypothetical protein WJX81_004510 [Elliptochloris bilobata]|uniref:RNA helicase n=1 Tax=Elliptochloris bilobata TaxID=381761 RepID=A0AAW1RNB5_9CHLO